jgi:hypothetical protein
VETVNDGGGYTVYVGDVRFAGFESAIRGPRVQLGPAFEVVGVR